MTFSYDDDADVLYLDFADFSGKATYVENTSGDILRVDIESGRVLGVTVLFFMRRMAQGDISIPEVGFVPFTNITTQLLESRKTHGKH